MMIGGYFTSVNGQPRDCVARLSADGSVDESFTTLQGPNGAVVAVEVDPERRVYIGGAFTTYRGIARSHFARLREESSLDLAWTNIVFWPDNFGTVRSVKRQPDRKFLLQGSLLTVSGQGRYKMINPTYRRLSVHLSQWMLDISPNDDSAASKVGQSYAWNPEPGRNATVQLKAILPMIVALGHNFKSQKRLDELAQLRGIFSLIPEEILPEFVKTNLPKVL